MDIFNLYYYYYYYSEVLVTPTQSLQASKKKFHVFLLGGENVMGGRVCVWGGGGNHWHSWFKNKGLRTGKTRRPKAPKVLVFGIFWSRKLMLSTPCYSSSAQVVYQYSRPKIILIITKMVSWHTITYSIWHINPKIVTCHIISTFFLPPCLVVVNLSQLSLQINLYRYYNLLSMP